MIKVQYKNQEDRQSILDEYKERFLIEDQVLIEGNFLIFSDEPLPEPIVYVSVPQEEFERLKQDSTLLKAQSSALSERADLVEDVIAEMAVQVYE
ncbi:hypothetical protein N6H13_10480 [Paenibacillus sp. CC-CFT742]|nr:hypothetical protein [Paenibacillus sp. CC-CFT742]WJH30962.1 hypothetical protein N6H13_10480 [Paenibacillus sp. CC-CFT742]